MDGLVHESSDPVVVVAGDKFGESAGVEFASGRLKPRREPLGVLEDVVGDRYGSFHTKSITGDSRLGKAGGTRISLTLADSASALDRKHDPKMLRGGKSNAGKGFWSRRTFHRPGGRRSTGVNWCSAMVMGSSSNHHRIASR